jgi:signal transduction histidine kinase
VKGHLKRIRDLKRIRIIFSANDEERIDQLDNHYKLMFYRIIQEQLTNVLKYSKATVVRIKMHACENALTLKIADNGVGFDTAKVEGGIGFSSLRRRVNQLGGAFQIESSVGNGCSIYVNFKGCK